MLSDDAHENPENIARDVDQNTEGTRKNNENLAPLTEIPRKANLIDDDTSSFDVNLANVVQELARGEGHVQPDAYKSATDMALQTQPSTFSRLQAMAKRGELLTSLQDCTVPQCAACNYARATKKPWRTKGPRFTRELPTIKRKAGDCVSGCGST